jgi:hypothetical protein
MSRRSGYRFADKDMRRITKRRAISSSSVPLSPRAVIPLDDLRSARRPTLSLQMLHFSRGATMYELLGALAFSALVAGYVLAVVFIRHREGEQFSIRRPTRPGGA